MTGSADPLTLAGEGERAMETPIEWLLRRVTSLRGARNPHVPVRTLRLLRAARLVLHPSRSLNQRFPSCSATY
jgi:hypothetical protein